MMKFKLQNLFNLTFSNFIVSQIGNPKPDHMRDEEEFREKLILNAIKSNYSTNLKMTSLTLYVGYEDAYCVVFTCENKNEFDNYPNIKSIFWSKDGELSMINEDWIDIWHLKKDYIQLLENHIEKIDYSNKIEEYIRKSKI